MHVAYLSGFAPSRHCCEMMPYVVMEARIDDDRSSHRFVSFGAPVRRRQRGLSADAPRGGIPHCFKFRSYGFKLSPWADLFLRFRRDNLAGFALGLCTHAAA